MSHLLTFRFRGLFFALLGILALAPLLGSGPLGATGLDILLTVVFLAALNAVSEGERPSLVGYLPAGLAILSLWASRLSEGSRIAMAVALGLSIVFAVYVVVKSVAYVARARKVTSEVLFGALCSYLLIGLLFVLLYAAVDLWEPGSFSLPAASSGPALFDASRFSVITYFSFVTLTTLGFGDIAPLTPLARSIVTMEALFGQLFLAVLMARIVALHIIHETSEE
jgi:voltage-gated potassium channel